MGVKDRVTEIGGSVGGVFGKIKDLGREVVGIPGKLINRIISTTKAAALGVIRFVGTPVSAATNVAGEGVNLATTVASAAVTTPMRVIGMAKDIITYPIKPLTDKLPALPSPVAGVEKVRDAINGGVDNATGGVAKIFKQGEEGSS